MSGPGALDAGMADFNTRPRMQRDQSSAPPPIDAARCAPRPAAGHTHPSNSAPSAATRSEPSRKRNRPTLKAPGKVVVRATNSCVQDSFLGIPARGKAPDLQRNVDPSDR